MKLNKTSIFLFLWVCVPIVQVLASTYSLYPNQIYIATILILFLSSFLVFQDAHRILKYSFLWMLLPLSYSIVFIIVSLFGVDFDASLRYQVQYLPMVCIDFFLAFLVGYKYDNDYVFRYLKKSAILISLYYIIIFLAFPDDPKSSPPLNVVMALPLVMITKEAGMLIIMAASLFASTKKMAVALAVITLVATFLLLKANRSIIGLENWNLKKKSVKLTRKIVYLSFAIFIGAIIFKDISGVIDRFNTPVEDDDPYRMAISLLSLKLLIDYFPYGVGWAGFTSLSLSEINYQTFTASGEAVLGATIHNSYVAWALEGGLAIVVLVLLLFTIYLNVVNSLWKNEKTRMFAIVALVWLMQGAVFAFAHQWHTTMYFWMMFGLVFGRYVRSKNVS